MRAALATVVLLISAVLAPATARADTQYGIFHLVIEGRYDFHTWMWSLSRCKGDIPECLRVTAIPQPIAKAFSYRGDAALVDEQWVLSVDVPDGLRCGDVYFGPVVATRDVYTWDPVTRAGWLESSFAAGCDGRPGTLRYPFSLARL